MPNSKPTPVARIGRDHFDLAIIGGGLSGCLTLAAIKYWHPHIKIVLIEKNSKLGGNHTWCFHDHDIPASARPWLTPLISKSWESYHVQFPKYEREIKTAYHSIRSEDLHEKLTEKYSKNISLNTSVEKMNLLDPRKPNLDGHTILTSEGRKLHAHSVIEAKGWVHNFEQGSVAYQKFVGLDVKLKKPHGLTSPILKDVKIPQIDGYRFFYILPWSENELLVEDTYYSNHSILKAERIEVEIKKYIEMRGWEIDHVIRKETGCLPLTLYPLRPEKSASGVTSIGAQSLFFNPVTGYTFPQAIRMIESVASKSALTDDSISKVIQETKQKYKGQDKYFRLLNRMMFLAAQPDKRYIILERFYQLNVDLIERFYSGTLTKWDQARILIGKPPVSISKALGVLRDKI